MTVREREGQLLVGLETWLQESGRQFVGSPRKAQDTDIKRISPQGKALCGVPPEVFLAYIKRLAWLRAHERANRVLKSLQDHLGHLDCTASMKVVNNRFWCPADRQDVE